MQHMDISRDVSIIKTIPLFKGLEDAGLQKMLQLAFVKDYDAGIVLFHEATPGDVMYVILSGAAQMVKKDPQGERIIAHMQPGDFFGEMALIDDDVRTATARVSTPSRMLVITRRAFLHMMKADPAVTSLLLMAFLKKMSHRLRRQ